MVLPEQELPTVLTTFASFPPHDKTLQVVGYEKAINRRLFSPSPAHLLPVCSSLPNCSFPQASNRCLRPHPGTRRGNLAVPVMTLAFCLKAAALSITYSVCCIQFFHTLYINTTLSVNR